MARTASKTASILSELYEETFSNDSFEPFRFTWADLRGIAGVAKLTPLYLSEIDQALNNTGFALIKFDDFLVVTQESDMSHFRLVPPRVVEQFLYDEANDFEIDDEDEDEDDLEFPNDGVIDSGEEGIELSEDVKQQVIS
jgi:hypothetical protein